MKKYLILSLTILIIPLYAQQSDTSENKRSGIVLRSPAEKPGQTTPLFIITAEDKEFHVKSTTVDSSRVETVLNEINPHWITSIAVLKDTAAVSVYGPSGQFGVILIKLKEGIFEKMPIGLRDKFKVQ